MTAEDAERFGEFVHTAAALLVTGADGVRIGELLIEALEGEHRLTDENGNTVATWPEPDLNEVEARMYQVASGSSSPLPPGPSVSADRPGRGPELAQRLRTIANEVDDPDSGQARRQVSWLHEAARMLEAGQTR